MGIVHTTQNPDMNTTPNAGWEIIPVSGRMPTEQILLFLDIQGVLCHPNYGFTLNETGIATGAVRGAGDLISAIGWADWIEPMWISSLGKQAQQWNDWAGTQRWEVAYPLPDSQFLKARNAYPMVGDGKCLAARWCSRRWQHRVVWIEDRFSLAAKRWAEDDSRVMLISTCPYEARVSSDRTGVARWNIDTIKTALRLTDPIDVDG